MSAHLHDISGSDQATLSAVAVEDMICRLLSEAAARPVLGDNGSCLGHIAYAFTTASDDGVLVGFADGSSLSVRAEAL